MGLFLGSYMYALWPQDRPHPVSYLMSYLPLFAQCGQELRCTGTRSIVDAATRNPIVSH